MNKETAMVAAASGEEPGKRQAISLFRVIFPKVQCELYSKENSFEYVHEYHKGIEYGAEIKFSARIMKNSDKDSNVICDEVRLRAEYKISMTVDNEKLQVGEILLSALALYKCDEPFDYKTAQENFNRQQFIANQVPIVHPLVMQKINEIIQRDFGFEVILPFGADELNLHGMVDKIAD